MREKSEQNRAGGEPLKMLMWVLGMAVMGRFVPGLLGSKPYASSGSYINKMSDYCRSCRFDVKKKTGEEACPFNYLYWDFLARNEDKLSGNARLRNPYATWRRMSDDKRAAYRESATAFLATLK